ncbi:MAG TPA: hypothetical protein VMI75_03915 [Polyangiaceae bacterium]|nr:hypothetical protein [Polyangiaceae bacterium]
MKTGLLFSGTALLGLCVVSAFPGCGSSSNGNNAGDGGQTGDTSTNDSSSSSGGGDDGSSGDANDEGTTGDTGTTCTATVMPKGTQILASSTVTVQGVTSDGQVIFYDGNTQKLNAVAAAGGTPAVIGTWDKSQSLIFTSNKVALYWNGATQTTSAHGQLGVWTAAGGQHTLGNASFFGVPGGGYVDVSADGSLVIYMDNVTTANADIFVAGSDGSNPTKLVAAASVGANCRPVVRFAGNTAVVSYCTAPPDAGTTLTANVEAYSGPPNWQTKQTFAAGDGFYGFSLGPIGAGDGGASGYNISYLTNSGQYVEALGGTTPTLIDAKGAGGVTFMHNGTDVIYFESDSSVWRSPIATPAPVLLAKGPFAGTLALSSDDNWIEMFLSQNSTNFFTDMYLLSTTPADGGNTPTTLASTAAGANFGDAFTADDKHVLFFPNVVMSGSAGYVGAYDTFPLPPPVGMMPTTIAQNVWEEFATTGAKTLYNDNYASNAGFAGAADIESTDLSTTAMPTTLVSQADANFFLTADKGTIVYSWSACPGAKDGIYTLPAP